MNEINHHYVWTVIGAMALATFITRAAPFVLLSGLKG